MLRPVRVFHPAMVIIRCTDKDATDIAGAAARPPRVRKTLKRLFTDMAAASDGDGDRP